MLERTDYPDAAKPFFLGGKLISPKEAEMLWHEVDEQLNLYNDMAPKNRSVSALAQPQCSKRSTTKLLMPGLKP